MNNGKKNYDTKKETYVCYYSFGSQFIYKYGIFIVGALLLFYLIAGIYASVKDIANIFFVFFIILIFYLFIKKYYETLKNLPFKITVNDEKIVCEKFFLRYAKKIEISYSDIDKLDGGIFDGRFLKPMNVHSTKRNITFSFYNRLKNSDKLIYMILKNVDKTLYKQVIDNLSKRGILFNESKQNISNN